MPYEYTRSEYLKALLNQKRQLDASDNNLVNPSIDSSNIGELARLDTNFQNVSSVTDIQAPEEERDERNWWQRTLDTAHEFVTNIGQGALQFVEGIVDAGAWLGGAVGNIFGADTDWAEDFMAKDLSSYANSFLSKMDFAYGLLGGNYFDEDRMNAWGQDYFNQIHEDSWIDNTSKGGGIYQNITTGIGNVLPSIIVGILTGGASTAVQAAAGAAMLGATGVSAFGNSTTEAMQDGANYYQAGGTGVLSAGIEVGTELASAGIGKGLGKLFGKSASKAASGVMNKGIRIGGYKFGAKLTQFSIKEIGKAALEEGTEEFVSELLSPLTKITYKGKEAFEEYKTKELYENALVSFVGGAIGGVFGDIVQTTHNKKKFGIAQIETLQDVATLHQAALEEQAKGDNANKELINQYEERIGELSKQFVNEMEEMQETDEKKYLATMDLILRNSEFNENMSVEEVENKLNEIDQETEQFISETNESENADVNQNSLAIIEQFSQEQEQQQANENNNNQNVHNQIEKVEKVERLDSVDGEVVEKTKDNFVKGTDIQKGQNAWLVKDSANWYKERVINLNKSEDIIDNVVESFKNDLLKGEKDVKVKVNKADLGRELFDDLSLIKDSKTLNNEVDKIVDKILKAEISYKDSDGNKQTFTLNEMQTQEMREKMQKLIRELANVKSRKSRISKIRSLVTSLYQTIDRNRKLYQKTMSLANELQIIKNKLKSIREIKANGGKTNYTEIKSSIAAIFKSYFAKLNFTKQGYFQVDNLKVIKELTTSVDGKPSAFDTMIDSIFNPNMYFSGNEIDTGTEVAFAAAQDMYQVVKDLAKELGESYNPKRKSMTLEQVEMFRKLNKAVMKLYNDSVGNAVEDARQVAERFVKKGLELAADYNSGKIKQAFTEKVLDALSPRDIVGVMTGGTYTDEFKLMYKDLIQKPYEEQVGEATNFKIKAFGDKYEKVKYTRKHLNDRITITDSYGRKVKARKYIVYQYYLNNLSPDNVERINNADMTYRDKVMHKISKETMDNLLNTLSETEKTELDKIFELYNNELKDYVEKIQDKMFNFHVSRQDYYPIVTSDMFKVQDFTQGTTQAFNINAMNNGRLKSLTNRRSVIELNVNPFILLNDYIDSMTVTGEIGIPSVKLNRLFNLGIWNTDEVIKVLKEKYGIKNVDEDTLSIEKGKWKYGSTDTGVKARRISYLSTVSQYIPNAKEYVSSIFNKLINNKNLTSSSSFFNALMRKWSLAKLSYNLKSMLKQPASFFTAMGKLGLGNGLKTMVRLNTLKTLFDRKLHRRLFEENAVFRHRLYENGAIKGISLTNGVAEFSSNVLQKFGEFGLKGMETADTITCYLTFAMCQTYAESQGYKIGTDENFNLANEMFTEVLLETQSNNDRIALSRIRSGEKGQLMQYAFGMFQSDSQNKLSQIFTSINDLKQINKQIKNAVDETEKAKLTATKKDLKRKLGSQLAGLIMSALAVVLGGTIADWIFDKKDMQDTFSEEGLYDSLIELTLNTTADWMPYVNQIVSATQYGQGLNTGTSTLNSILSVISPMIKSMKENGSISKKNISDLLLSIGEMSGIGFSNINKLITGMLGNFDPETAMKYKSLFYSNSPQYLGTSLKEQVAKGNYAKANSTLDYYMTTYKADYGDNKEVKRVLYKLYSDGYDVLPKNYMTSYTDSETGEQVDLTSQQITMFRNIYDTSTKAVKDLLNVTEYKLQTSEYQAKIIKKIYDTYYAYAKAKVLNTKADSKLANLLLYTNGNVNISNYMSILNTVNNITDSRMKTRKELVFEYVNRLRGYSKQEKLLILYLAGYSSNQNTQTLQSYLRQKGMSNNNVKDFLGIK